jgi:hypothetical protein
VAYILRDLFAGSVIVAVGLVLSLAALILFLLLWIFFSILGALVQIMFYVFLFFAALWIIGYGYRKLKEGSR